MAHVHSMRDSDSHFLVDPITRTVSNKGSPKSILIQNDHNSEIFTFELPRYVDGHDMTLCNRVEIHFVNSDSSTREQKRGIYEVADFEVSEDEPQTIIWSWTISNHATQLVGPLVFAFRFACVADDGVVEYSWSTSPFSGFTISNSIYNGAQVYEEYYDILEQWKNEIIGSILGSIPIAEEASF